MLLGLAPAQAADVGTTDCAQAPRGAFGHDEPICVSGGLDLIDEGEEAPDADLYVVVNRAWDDPLPTPIDADVADGPIQIAVAEPGVPFTDVALWMPPVGPDGGYDVVLDADENGLFDPAIDWVCGAGPEPCFTIEGFCTAVSRPLVAALDESSQLYTAHWDAAAGAFARYQRVGGVGATRSRSVGLADFNNDGFPDVVLGASTSRVIDYHLWINDGCGGFHYRGAVGRLADTGNYAIGMATGDFDNDGHMDFVGGGNSAAAQTYLGDGQGGFVPVGPLSFPTAGRGLDAADLDGDGHLDLVRGRYSSGRIEIFPGLGDGRFGEAIDIGDAGSDPYGVTVGDVDGDGRFDVLANAGANGDVSLYRGIGPFELAAAEAAPSLDLAHHGCFDTYDYNGDGALDFVATNHSGRQLVYAAGVGDGTFGPIVIVGATTGYGLAVSALAPGPRAGWAKAVVSPATQTLNVGDAASLSGVASENSAHWVWHLDNGTDGPSGDGPPGPINPLYAAEGRYTPRLAITDAGGRVDIAGVDLIVRGAPPVVSTDAVTFDERTALDGVWPLTLDGADYATDDAGIVDWRWSLAAYADDFEGGDLTASAWSIGDGGWRIDALQPEDPPLGGAQSLRQPDATTANARILHNLTYVDDVEIDLDFHILDGGENFSVLLGALNFYQSFEVQLRGDRYDDLRILRRVNDSASVRLTAGLGHELLRGVTYHLRVAQVGDRITAWLDDRVVATVRDDTFKTGRVGLATYRTAMLFDNLSVRSVISGQSVSHVFPLGRNEVTLTVRDAADQEVTGTIPMVMTGGEPPTSDGGGPYAVDELTGEADGGYFIVPLDGSASNDADGSDLRYQWDFGTARFDGTALEPGRWITGGNVRQEEAIIIDGTGAWGANYAFSRANYPRAAGLSLQATVRARQAMVGWKNTSDIGQYRQLIYGMYLNNGWIDIYEEGESRARITRFERDAPYEVRIDVLAERGARYAIRPAGVEHWQVLYESDHSEAAELKRGFDVYAGTLTVDDLRELGGGPTPRYPVYGVGDHPGILTVSDGAGQTSTAPVMVSTAPNDRPVADAGGDQVVGENAADGGIWTVALDTSGSSDDHGILRYEWDLEYDDALGFRPTTETELNPTLTFDQPGAYAIALRVTDNALQTDIDVITITVGAGAPPVADAGGAYIVDEFTGDAWQGGFTVALDGNGSTDAESDLVYIWTFSPDRFEGSEIFDGKWTHTEGITQNDSLTISGDSGWGKRYLFSNDTYPRAEGARFEASITMTRNRAMLGFKNDSDSGHYNQYPYAFYFYNGSIRIYESGASRGDTGFDYIPDERYDVRIELKPDQGARYAYRLAGDAEWTQVYDSDVGDLAVLRRGFDVHSGTLTLHALSEIATGPTPTYRLYGIAEREVTLTVLDDARQAASDTTTVTTLGNQPPAAQPGPDRAAGEIDGFRGTWRAWFDAEASTDDRGVYRYRWDFDYDGEFQTDAKGVEGTYLYDAPGVYTVALMVWDHALQSHLETLTVTIGQGEPPIADAGLDVVGEGIWPVAFDAAGSTDDVAIERYMWDFGDGTMGTGARTSHTYWVPGEYTATLTVRDRANQSGQDTRRVTIGAGEAPMAEAGGPYVSGAGGPPVYLDSAGSTDDYGIVEYLWDADDLTDSDGDGDFTNDADVTGRRPLFVHGSQGAYTVTLTVKDGAGQVTTDQAIVNVVENVPPDVITVPWVASDPTTNPLSRHIIVNASPTRLKAIVRDAGPLTYQWDFGDGTEPWPIEPAAVADPYAIEAVHTYPDSPNGTPYCATLRVWDADGEMGADRYCMIVRPDDLEARTDISADEGLWYMHKQQARPEGQWPASSNYWASSAASALQAFMINGHMNDGDLRENPYVETVGRGLDYLFTQLRAFEINEQTYGDPDTNGNGIAVDAVGGRVGYQLGMVMDALASTGKPLAVARTGPDNVKGRYYHHLLTDMVDAYAWGQYDHATIGGGWRYNWNTAPDNSACQWASIGMQAAEFNFDIHAPQWVRDRNLVWLAYSYDGTGYGYGNAGNGVATTPSAMVQLAYNGVPTHDPRWLTAENHIASQWLEQSGTTYGLFALVKAMRTAQPASVATLGLTGLDWYNDPDVGVRRHLIDRMVTSGANWGSWSIGTHGSRMLQTTWAVIMLTPSLFVQPPVAVTQDDVVWAYGEPLRYSAIGSFHRDPSSSVVLYEWDFDGDGHFDLVTDDPDDPRAVFTFEDPDPDQEGDPPESYVAQLRVTDDQLPPQIDLDVRHIIVAEPPHAPYALAGEPYEATVGIPITLDASGSFDIDPGDRVTGYEWDLDDDGRFFDDVDITTDRATVDHVFLEPGTFQIALRVKDAGAFNPLGCVVDVNCEPMTSLPNFTRLRVAVNLPPVADAGGPYQAFEGALLPLDASRSFDPNENPLQFLWDLDGDGDLNDADTGQVEHRWADDGTYEVVVEVSDSLQISRDTAQVVIDNVAPTVSVGPALQLAGGAPLARTVTFEDPGADQWSATADYGAGPQALEIGPNQSFELVHVYARSGDYRVVVTVTDDDGGVGTAELAVGVGNRPPQIELGSPAAIQEGETLLRAGRFVDHDADVWAATVDYGLGAGAIALPVDPDQSFLLSQLYVDDGLHTVRVTVDDSVESTLAALELTVHNVAPIVDVGEGVQLAGGESLDRPGAFVDPGADQWTATVDYGDDAGSGPLDLTPDKRFVLRHDYVRSGQYIVTVQLTDDDGDTGQAELRVDVGNRQPSIELGEPLEIEEGAPWTRVGTFVDADRDQWTATVDYDDGAGPRPLEITPEQSFTLNHTYDDEGAHEISVVIDDGVEARDATLTVTAGNVSPTVDVGEDVRLPPGGQLTREGHFADPGADAWTATVSWGDGAPDEPVALQPDHTFELVHDFDGFGPYTVTVTVDDGDTGTGTASFVVEVDNAPPVLEAPGDAQIAEGALFEGVVVIRDPDGAIWQGTIDWGDGLEETFEPTPDVPVDLSHRYGQDGEYPIGITVSDELSTVEAQLQVQVTNVPPTIDIGEDVSIDAGAPFERLGHFDDPGDDAWVATVDWGAGEGPEPLSLTDDQSFTLAHIYDRPGQYEITVAITDDHETVLATIEARVRAIEPCPDLDDEPPTADAGLDMQVCAHQATLDGRASSDNCDIEQYTWWRDDIELGQGSVLVTDLDPGVHTIRLTVCDVVDLCADDTVTITVVQGRGDECASGLGFCRRDGVLLCTDDGGLVCSAEPGEPQPERCNHADDDCDGETDEDYPPQGDPCTVGEGACEREGTISCAASGLTALCLAGPPPPPCRGPDLAIEPGPAQITEGTPFPVAVAAADPNGVGRVTLIHRRHPQADWQRIDMDPSVAASSSYEAVIPGAEITVDRMEYYIEAEDGEGNLSTAPEHGPHEPMVVRVNEAEPIDREAPRFVHFAPPVAIEREVLAVSTLVVDASGVATVELRHRARADDPWQVVPLDYDGASRWSAEVTHEGVAGESLSYYLVAVDDSPDENTAFHPPDAPETLHVLPVLPPPEPDMGVADVGTPDSGASDAGPPDVYATDLDPPDGEPADLDPPDAKIDAQVRLDASVALDAKPPTPDARPDGPTDTAFDAAPDAAPVDSDRVADFGSDGDRLAETGGGDVSFINADGGDPTGSGGFNEDPNDCACRLDGSGRPWTPMALLCMLLAWRHRRRREP